MSPEWIAIAERHLNFAVAAAFLFAFGTGVQVLRYRTRQAAMAHAIRLVELGLTVEEVERLTATHDVPWRWPNWFATRPQLALVPQILLAVGFVLVAIGVMVSGIVFTAAHSPPRLPRSATPVTHPVPPVVAPIATITTPVKSIPSERGPLCSAGCEDDDLPSPWTP